ncbi:MAG TPA: hypothetical protein VMR41_04325 [Patescibacteria group bacterium]|nr:hypothetical protein [Patescibacteria group bacterium]
MAQKIHSTTQHFTEIVDIIDNIVILAGGYACCVIELTATNFALLSQEEQNAKIYNYAALLNSLSFPIQVLVRNKRVDVTEYMQQLDNAERLTLNPKLKQQIEQYKAFVEEMVTVNTVLNKQFYIIISYSSLEGGLAAVAPGKGSQRNVFIQSAQKTLLSKAESIHGQLSQIAASTKLLEREELIKLFYDIFNNDSIEPNQVIADIATPVIQTQTQ